MSANTLCWADIPVTNLDRAIKFYSAVLGAEVRKLSADKTDYGLLPHDEGNSSACLCLRSDSGGVDNRPSANGPLIYLLVERLDQAVEAARKNGGKILRTRQQIGEHGFRAVIIDSEGNRIALHTSTAGS
jgi:predicted enzyme related to lactoylglutathione lyase